MSRCNPQDTEVKAKKGVRILFAHQNIDVSSFEKRGLIRFATDLREFMHFRYANHPSNPYDTRKSGFNDSTTPNQVRAVPWPLAIHHDTLQQSIQNDVPTILEAAFTDASDQSSLYWGHKQSMGQVYLPKFHRNCPFISHSSR